MLQKKRKSKHPSSDVKVRAIQAYRAGDSAASIARSLDVDRTTVHRWTRDLSRRGMERKKSPGNGRPSKLNTKMRWIAQD